MNETNAVKMVECPHCHGDGLSKCAIDRGMVCGYCHGNGEVDTEQAARMVAAKRQDFHRHGRAVSRYGY